MTTGIAISTEHNAARLAGTLAFLDTGTDNARIRIYGDVRPAAGGAETTLLVEIKLDKPSGTVAGGVLTLSSSDIPLVLNSGEATWARIVNGGGDWSMDCDVSDESGDAAVKLPSTTLYAGGKTVLVSGVLG